MKITKWFEKPRDDDDDDDAGGDAENKKKSEGAEDDIEEHQLDDEELEEAEPSAFSVSVARLLIKFSPFFFVLFLAIPIAFAGAAAAGGFELDTTMDAFTIRDHPAAEMFTTYLNARDLSREQEQENYYVQKSSCSSSDSYGGGGGGGGGNSPGAGGNMSSPSGRRHLVSMSSADSGFGDDDFNNDFGDKFNSFGDSFDDLNDNDVVDSFGHLTGRGRGRRLSQASSSTPERWDYSGGVCNRMRFYLTFVAEGKASSS